MNNNLSLEKKLIIDEIIAEIIENFYSYRPTYIKYLIYDALKRCNPAEFEYFVQKISENRKLYELVFVCICEFTYMKPAATGLEDEISKTKIIMDEAGKYITLKLFDYQRGINDK
uniref:hypothetical protein n=1 Tax=Candidatus Scatousia sp. TaxID=3085663 RepID=UPI004027CA30